MSSANGSGWVNMVLVLLAGGLVLYGLVLGPGTCPWSRPAPSTVPGATAPAETESAAAQAASLVHADDNSLEQILRDAKEPVLVDFYADWCGPCQKLAPVLDRVAEDLTGGRIVKVNVDHSPKMASRYGVRSIPTLLVFNDGEVVKRSMGLHSEDEIRQLLQ